MLLALIKTLRPRQWIKNLFVAVPLMYGQRLTDPTSLLVTAGAVALFCLISGCVYILNDLVDVEKDRAHPKKRHRPIPSGKLPEAVARRFAVICVPVCLALGYWLQPLYAAALGGYFLLNLAYSFKLKQIAYVDVLSIAAGFILRVLAGALALGIPASPWLLGCTGLLAMFLGFGKRAHELAGAEDPQKQRAALAAYNLVTLRIILYALGFATVGLYIAYTLSEHVLEMFGTNRLAYTAVFGVVGIARFIYLSTTRREAESPTEEMLKDPLFMINFVVWIALTAAILYGWI
ncbi:XapX domain-containing protein [Nannocystis exedens]|uniref:XapX domain-containing protein n=1 Tax=Nannocystis exedens TaxID=54 RepID=A0A1I1SVN1_9BACT|nr:UbiA prenyltransferase family protein [Nannocystis exedens]PCC66966.1 Decaprenyl-phosphate phosphoribosyltransferase [Nannocystis exedens]SFD50412.1 XapX domain-containing protein [Nannocystis exedens]